MANMTTTTQIDTMYAKTDEKYHHHIAMIQGRPYMTVAGRVAMAVDEHASVGGKIHFHKPTFETVGDRLLCCATVTSDIRGTGSGTAEVIFNSKNPAERSNPFECAETSAIGRALGFLGYGTLMGLASYDEVRKAIDNQSSSKSTMVAMVTDIMDAKPVKTVANSNGHVQEENVRLASKDQMRYLKSLLSQRGTAKGHSDMAIAAVYGDVVPTMEQVIADIDTLRDAELLPVKYLKPYLNCLRKMVNVSADDIVSYLKKYFNKAGIGSLTREEQDQLIGWLLIGNEEENSEEILEEDDNASEDNDLDLALDRICELSDWSKDEARDFLNGYYPKSWNLDKRRAKVFEVSDEELTRQLHSFSTRQK